MGTNFGPTTFFFFKVDVAVFPDKDSIKSLWFGKISVLASTVEDAREKAILIAKSSPEVVEKTKYYSDPLFKVYSMNRSRQVFKNPDKSKKDKSWNLDDVL